MGVWRRRAAQTGPHSAIEVNGTAAGCTAAACTREQWWRRRLARMASHMLTSVSCPTNGVDHVNRDTACSDPTDKSLRQVPLHGGSTHAGRGGDAHSVPAPRPCSHLDAEEPPPRLLSTAQLLDFLRVRPSFPA